MKPGKIIRDTSRRGLIQNPSMEEMEETGTQMNNIVIPKNSSKDPKSVGKKSRRSSQFELNMFTKSIFPPK